MKRLHLRYYLLVGIIFLIIFSLKVVVNNSSSSEKNGISISEPIGVNHNNKDSKSPNSVSQDAGEASKKAKTLESLNDAEKKKLEEKLKEQEKIKEDAKLCTAFNPVNNHFVDLSGLSSYGNENKPTPWFSKGFDTGLNFTVGICSNPFKRSHQSAKDVKDVDDTSKVGAYYIDPTSGMFVSMGEYSTRPVVRGKKITLTYENGSYCENAFTKDSKPVRKSTVISFICDREMFNKASVSFIGSSNDCSYFFEVRSHYACPTAAREGNISVFWIFIFILIAALLVFAFGSSLYNSFQRGKRIPEKITA